MMNNDDLFSSKRNNYRNFLEEKNYTLTLNLVQKLNKQSCTTRYNELRIEELNLELYIIMNIIKNLKIKCRETNDENEKMIILSKLKELNKDKIKISNRIKSCESIIKNNRIRKLIK